MLGSDFVEGRAVSDGVVDIHAASRSSVCWRKRIPSACVQSLGQGLCCLPECLGFVAASLLEECVRGGS